MKLNKYINVILGLPKTIYLNLRLLPFNQAIKLPILISNKVKISDLSGKAEFNGDIKFATVKIGFGDVGIFDKQKQRSIIQLGGKIILGNNINLGHGIKISVGKYGILKLSNRINVTAETSIVCHNEISIGEDCLISWENLIMDTDFHTIMDYEENVINESLPINIGEKVWMGCRCTILKGTKIRKNSVISSNSRISKIIDEENVVIGDKGKILKRNIIWKQ